MKLGSQIFYSKNTEFEVTTNKVSIDTSRISEGINDYMDLIVYRCKNHLIVYDRICDHNGGKLITNNGKTSCPLHGWDFDPSSGTYTNAECMKQSLFDGYIEIGQIIEINLNSLRRNIENFNDQIDFDIRFLNHACLLITIPGLKFATDPWLLGSAFCNGWWLSHPSPSDAIHEVNSCDFIYISHNHPDHLNTDTLSHIRKDMPIITGNFTSNSTKNYLIELGFEQVFSLDFNEKWLTYNQSFAFSILKSGDFRDDSGLLLEIGNKTILFAVDSNFIDFWRFPKHIDLIASSFAGGASGFPLCFDNYTHDEKERLVERNKKSIYTINKMLLKKIKPKIFLPYAGFFTESANRDKYIANLNQKNSIGDYLDICTVLDIDLIDPIATPIIKFQNNDYLIQSHNISSLNNEIPEIEISKNTSLLDLNEYEVVQYFENSRFFGELDLLLIPTDDDFTQINKCFYVAFYKDKPPDVFINEPNNKRANINFLEIKVRSTELCKVIQRGLPWEDLSIGFQCRIYREPNVYNSRFWHYFTNIYVNKNVGKRSRNCSGCELISQAIY
ncbi:MBL fold metallo-hydrolase [Amylibacter sp.]|nr:MBL fold metallo-hydrolase [Amylibacter sp.]